MFTKNNCAIILANKSWEKYTCYKYYFGDLILINKIVIQQSLLLLYCFFLYALVCLFLDKGFGVFN